MSKKSIDQIDSPKVMVFPKQANQAMKLNFNLNQVFDRAKTFAKI